LPPVDGVVGDVGVFEYEDPQPEQMTSSAIASARRGNDIAKPPAGDCATPLPHADARISFDSANTLAAQLPKFREVSPRENARQRRRADSCGAGSGCEVSREATVARSRMTTAAPIAAPMVLNI
jgi:hypothetical protein